MADTGNDKPDIHAHLICHGDGRHDVLIPLTDVIVMIEDFRDTLKIQGADDSIILPLDALTQNFVIFNQLVISGGEHGT